jgi:FecR-like protein
MTMVRGGVWRRALIGICILSQTLSMYAWPGTTSLGTARSSRAVEVSLDDGKAWLALGGRSSAVMPESLIRSRSGSALVELIDGSRVTILPFSAVRFHGAPGTMEVVLQHGRLTFQVPVDAQLEISTPSARLAPDTVFLPLFDVNGGYLGYLDDTTFYPQMRMAQAIGAGAAAGGVNWGVVGLSIGLFAAVNIVGAGSVSGAFGGGSPSPATPLQPIR